METCGLIAKENRNLTRRLYDLGEPLAGRVSLGVGPSHG